VIPPVARGLLQRPPAPWPGPTRQGIQREAFSLPLFGAARRDKFDKLCGVEYTLCKEAQYDTDYAEEMAMNTRLGRMIDRLFFGGRPSGDVSLQESQATRHARPGVEDRARYDSGASVYFH